MNTQNFLRSACITEGPNPLTAEWMAEHAAEVGQDDGLRSFDELRDRFNPSDMSTNLARGKWVEAVEAEYKEVLAKRAE